VSLYQKTAFTIYIDQPSNLNEKNPLDGTEAKNVFPQFQEKQEKIMERTIKEYRNMGF
jgi:hypothetical protein